MPTIESIEKPIFGLVTLVTVTIGACSDEDDNDGELGGTDMVGLEEGVKIAILASSFNIFLPLKTEVLS